jgi:hypothetical protein
LCLPCIFILFLFLLLALVVRANGVPLLDDGLPILILPVVGDGILLLLVVLRREARAARRGSFIPPMPPYQRLPLAISV